MSATYEPRDPNYWRLEAFKRIHKLTSAIDALVARDYIAEQRMEMLDDLEAYVARMEQELNEAEANARDVQHECALLRSSEDERTTRRRAVGAQAGERKDVTELWSQYGLQMLRLYEQNMRRLEKLEIREDAPASS